MIVLNMMSFSGYYHQRPVPGSDGSTFAVLGLHYAKDATHVFYSELEPAPKEPLRKTIQVSGADAASFVPLEDATDSADGDRNHTYYRGRRVTGAK